jgi:hypothetical protein
MKFWEGEKATIIAGYYFNTKADSPYSKRTHLTEVACCGTTEEGHETWTKSSPVLQAIVLIHLPAGTHGNPDAHLCLTGLQAAKKGTDSHLLFPVPATSTIW